ncbi:MAG: flagellar hook-basal body complex protein [Alphaproteobacteria bacterium]|nr:flagellar hook-basal body complex protein [Alphaproteobacteria bacterium]MBF0335074.1 flagellar hook-basal body complex protein [Alphaproteobacteria bacterium]
MSLYGALFAGVSGLSSQASAMGAISDNVTNVNTVGYKGTKINFQTLVTKQVSMTKYSPGGVQSAPRGGMDVQGLLQATSSSTDISLSGQGFFVTNTESDPATTGTGMFAYSRAGSFKVDKDGYLRNVGGFYLQGWPLVPSNSNPQAREITIGANTYMKAYWDAGVSDYHYVNENIVSTTEMRSLNVNELGGTADATTGISLGANLPSSDDIGDEHDTSILIYDSLGNPHNTVFSWHKISENMWGTRITPPVGVNKTEITDDDGNVHTAAARFEFASAPSDDMTCSINGLTYEFDSDASGASAAGNIVVTYDGTLASALQNIASKINSSDGGELFSFYSESSLIIQKFGGNAASTMTVPAGIVETGSSNSVSLGAVPGMGAIDLSTTIATDTIIIDGNTFTYVAGTPANEDEIQIGGTTAATLQATINAIKQHSTIGDNFTATGDGNFLRVWAKDGTSSSTITPLATMLDGLGNAPAAFTVEGVGSPALVFNGNGTPASGGINISKMTHDFWNGSLDMDGTTSSKITLSLGTEGTGDGMTQFSGNYQITYINQNGAKFGNFSGVTIGEDGVVTALFDNGVRVPVFQIPVATFTNANGLESLTGNSWIATTDSGDYTLRTAGQAGAGTIAAAALESSTVDLGEEFTTMITTQRAYSASAKIITSADEMLDELIRIKR